MVQSSSNSRGSNCMSSPPSDKGGPVDSKIPQPPPLQPPPPLQMSRGAVDSKQKDFVTAGLAVMACVVVIGLFFGISFVICRAYYLRRNNSRRRNPPLFFGTQEDFLDENQEPAIYHPTWYINTVGLPLSIIDSITVFKYKKDEGLIEGTECSVCLSEFEEDENLRLLPKCSHAFHIPCIDTWLRSHKNCPLCRAPVICGPISAHPLANESEPSSNGLDSRSANVVGNHGRVDTTNSEREGETSDVRNGHDDAGGGGGSGGDGGAFPIKDMHTADNSKNSFPLSETRNSDSDYRVLSDLADNRRVVGEEGMQQMRRSVSLDSSSAATIYKAVANAVTHESLKSKNSKAKMVAKPTSSVSSSICKLMKSSSIGSTLQKGPVSMKRSRSSSSRHSRRHSVLPL